MKVLKGLFRKEEPSSSFLWVLIHSPRWRSSRDEHPWSPHRASVGALQPSQRVWMDAGHGDTGLAKLLSPVAIVASGGIMAPSPAFLGCRVGADDILSCLSVLYFRWSTLPVCDTPTKCPAQQTALAKRDWGHPFLPEISVCPVRTCMREIPCVCLKEWT